MKGLLACLLVLGSALTAPAQRRGSSGGGYHSGSVIDMSATAYNRTVPKHPDEHSRAQWMFMHYVACPSTGQVDRNCPGFKTEWITPVRTRNLHDPLNWWTNVQWVKR